MKKIVIDSHELTVLELYPYRYDFGKGKEVLRIKIAETDHAFSELKVLDNRGKEECPVIEYWKDDEPKIEYQEYNADFSVNYITENEIDIFSIEITRQGTTEVKLSQVETTTTENQSTIGELTVMLADLMFGE